MESKRKRNVNFSKSEEELLVELVANRKHVLENKNTDAVMWKEKELAWKKVTSEFNSLARSVPRTMEHLRLKFKNLKRNVRKRNAVITMEGRRTGGGPNPTKPLDEVENKIKGLIRLSVEGLPSNYDNDQTALTAPNEIDEQFSGEPEEIFDDNMLYLEPMVIGESVVIDTPLPSFSQVEDPKVTSQPKLDAAISTHLWDVVTPMNLKRKKSTPLRTNSSKKNRYKSISAEATNLMERKEETLALQKQCLKQDLQLNEERKKNLRLERINLRLERKNKFLQMRKLKLEIAFLQRKGRRR